MGSNQIKIISPLNLPDHEIDSYQDFEQIVNQKAGLIDLLIKNKIILPSFLFLLGSLSWYLYKTNVPVNADPVESLVPENSKSRMQVPVPVKITHEKKEEPQQIIEVKPKVVRQKQLVKSSPANTERPIVEKENELSEIENAAPVEGYDHLYTYFNQNLRYPKEALIDSIQGIVKLKFTVRSDSSISDISVVETVTDLFNPESIRLIANMPPWKPATHNGNPMDKEFIIPIRFNIQ